MRHATGVLAMIRWPARSPSDGVVSPGGNGFDNGNDNVPGDGRATRRRCRPVEELRRPVLVRRHRLVDEMTPRGFHSETRKWGTSGEGLGCTGYPRNSCRCGELDVVLLASGSGTVRRWNLDCRTEELLAVLFVVSSGRWPKDSEAR